MARIDQITATASELIGERILRGALIVPPGSRAYRNIGGGSGYSAASLALGVARSRQDSSQTTGAAAAFPRMLGLLAVGETTVYFFRTKMIGGQPTEMLKYWRVTQMAITFVAKSSDMRNPAVDIEFSDGSSLMAFGEKKWGIEQFA